MSQLEIPTVDSENTRTVSDDDFAGTQHETLPDVDLDLSCKSENNGQPSVVVDISQDDKWIRIPITEATMWENKDGEAAITRTSRIRFPMEWGGVSILQFIDGFLTQNNLAAQEETYDECRVYFYDDNTENDDAESRYIIKQYGYVGGVGPTGNVEGRFWVYDPAKLMGSIPASKSFSEPTYAEIIGYVRDQIVENSTFESIEIKEFASGDIPTQKEPADVDINIPSVDIGPFEYGIGVGILTPLVEGGLEFFANEVLRFNKSFKENRHNLVDLMNWYSDLTDARWWFEPTANGPELITDSNKFKENDKLVRRYFADQDSSDKVRNAIPDDASVFTDINILNNTAIVDMKPFNTFKVFGESQKPRTRNNNPYSGSTSGAPYTEEYPYVKVRYTPLYKRADNREYLPNPKESDKNTIEGAEAEAKSELRKHLAEATEGSIETRGEPHFEPYDYLSAVPVCQNTFPNTEATPMTWEINAIKHKHGGKEQYTCELGVSIAVEDEKIEVVESKYKSASKQ